VLYEGFAQVTANADVSCLGSAIYSRNAYILGSVTVTANGTNLGDNWTDVAVSANTWSDVAVNANTWTDVPVSSNTWLRQG
jgi:hypothetical protein